MTAEALAEYTAWASVPGHLKTKTQLRAAGLRPARGQQPAARFLSYIRGRSNPQHYKLYDQGQAVAIQATTDEQRARLAAGREKALKLRTCPGPGCYDRLTTEEYAERKRRYGPGYQYICRHCRARTRAIEWAREVLADDQAVILDTETTGLDEDAEIIEVALVDTTGRILLDTLVRPAGAMGGTHIHGITADDVAAAPAWPDVWPIVTGILEKASRVIVYNAEFDGAMIQQTCKLYDLPALDDNEWHCAMHQYAAWVNDWSEYHHGYKWQRLEGGHRAAGDCLACLEYIKRMAAELT